MTKSTTLLDHLLDCGYDPEDYLDTLDDLETLEKDQEYFKAHPEEGDPEEIEFISVDIETDEESLRDMRSGWKSDKTDMDEEIEKIKQWVKENRNSQEKD